MLPSDGCTSAGKVKGRVVVWDAGLGVRPDLRRQGSHQSESQLGNGAFDEVLVGKRGKAVVSKSVDGVRLVQRSAVVCTRPCTKVIMVSRRAELLRQLCRPA